MLERLEPSDLVAAFLTLSTPCGEDAPEWLLDDLYDLLVDELDGDIAIVTWSRRATTEPGWWDRRDESRDRIRRVRVSRLREVVDGTPIVTSRRSQPIRVGATFVVTPHDLERLLDD